MGDTDPDSDGGEELESDTADVTACDSGGPLFGWWSGDPRIVGVVSGEDEYSFLGITFDQDNIMAAGNGFTSLCAWGRSNCRREPELAKDGGGLRPALRSMRLGAERRAFAGGLCTGWWWSEAAQNAVTSAAVDNAPVGSRR